MSNMKFKSGGGGFSSLLKEGYKHFGGLEEAILKNIEACKGLSAITRTSLGPNGMNKLFVCCAHHGGRSARAFACATSPPHNRLVFRLPPAPPLLSPQRRESPRETLCYIGCGDDCRGARSGASVLRRRVARELVSTKLSARSLPNTFPSRCTPPQRWLRVRVPDCSPVKLLCTPCRVGRPIRGIY